MMDPQSSSEKIVFQFVIFKKIIVEVGEIKED